MRWLAAEPIESERLRLEPLTVRHGTRMVSVLADPSIYHFMGGEPPSALTLARQYRRQVVGHSPDGCIGWLNWIVTLAETETPIGVVQATLLERSQAAADLSWVITPAQQGRGYATEAATVLVGWLNEHGVTGFAANIHPEHGASGAVARRLGLHPTAVVVDGEVRWES
ncbi:N-acetyltransferase [Cryobacterium melibiosiphilum]|uniref:N-acetyltransferase n=1 Tax=Cryobacterium melibiosiphilum TaxID=995039 RepID=A0A3A5MUI8_9MICO|nr:GNAT family N-acetyltransferase [Cryobacterium melibiosiphilum]RJT88874.1 N-acetyltransferase [Cryobacterium melibiosiphilum]